jgi:tRNA nucleotidyltransferase (CCA-adding enzyme)
MKTYLVGGAVRDQLLNIPSKDKDWVVVGSTPEHMLSLGYKQVGADFPVFLHPKNQQEYALARTERKQGHGYQGFDVQFNENVTLEDDLIRRDLTINAMAQSDDGAISDPYNGQQDLKDKVLRHVSPAFSEDPLRVLRVARFAARFHHLGFTIAPETLTLMSNISQSGELEHLTPERVWVETERALQEKSPWVYFEVLRNCHALNVCFPELNALFGVPQPKLHHPEIDTGIHCLMVLQQATLLTDDPVIRFAALIHDLGKALTPKDNWPKHYKHEVLGLAPINDMCDRLRIPNAFRELALKTSEFHTHVHKAFELKAGTIWKLFRQCDALRKPQRFNDILLACMSDSRGRTGFENIEYPQADYLKALLKNAMSVQVKDIVDKGFQGAALGQEIEKARIDAIANTLPQLRSQYAAPHES